MTSAANSPELREVRVLGLERLIEIKERTGRPKDLAVLPVLRATLARTRGSTEP